MVSEKVLVSVSKKFGIRKSIGIGFKIFGIGIGFDEFLVSIIVSVSVLKKIDIKKKNMNLLKKKWLKIYWNSKSLGFFFIINWFC